ncbi:MAG: CheR family methyltransferase [Bryobacteraceae bacterium]|jgi:chemotaxis protein methyltransferase CheR
MPASEWKEPHPVAPLRPEEFRRICELARRTFGLDLRSGKEELVSARLRRLVQRHGLRSFDQYYRHVTEDKTGAALAAMIDALATNHTSFLREAGHFAFLREQVVPWLRGRPTVDVWSAACSTGEEIWTLAMVLNDAMPAARLQLVGTDISNRALEAAAEARYSAERCAALPAHWLTRYLAPEGHPAASYRVAPELRRQASFRRLNLTEPYNWPHLFPVIFCRNVMIYFDGPVQELVVRRLTGFLEPGGYLFVGHAESLTRVDHGLEYLRPAIYRKPVRREGKWIRSS